MDQAIIERWGDELYRALRDRKTIEPLTARHADITIDDAYHVSQHILRHCWAR